jgi:hypothetical protein
MAEWKIAARRSIVFSCLNVLKDPALGLWGGRRRQDSSNTLKVQVFRFAKRIRWRRRGLAGAKALDDWRGGGGDMGEVL